MIYRKAYAQQKGIKPLFFIHTFWNNQRNNRFESSNGKTFWWLVLYSLNYNIFNRLWIHKS